MFFPIQRVKTILNELRGLTYSKSEKIKEYTVKEGNYNSINEVNNSEKEWKVYNGEEPWAVNGDYHCWFRTEVKVPKDFQGETMAFKFSTFENEWDNTTNPQFILYVNGELVQGLDVNHREVLITENAKAGDTYKIDLHAYSGRVAKRCFLNGELIVIKKEVMDLFFNIQVPVLVCERLKADDKRRIDMEVVLNETINRLDLRDTASEEFYNSVKVANDYIKEELYEKMCGKEDVIATCVGHTHIDVAWLWTVAQTREKVTRSFSTVLKLMEEYPEYIFMSSQPQLYKFLKEGYPDIYEKVKQKIKEGVWEPEGSMWLEADCNVTSGESLVRQILFGKRFFKKEFNVDNEILWLPDVFGYSAALPQILKKSDVNYFMTTKISWNQFNKIPYDTFNWEGIDGTEILTHFITTQAAWQSEDSFFTTYNGVLEPAAIMGAWRRYQQKEINDDVLVAFGFGDGGGGATKEMLEMGKRMEKGIPGCPKIQYGTSKDYFKRLEEKVSGNKRLPRWVGELYLEFHRGTYTSMAENKKFNRKCENLYIAAENFNALAMTLGAKYPQDEINNSWENILLNQFHDILPGSSIKEVYDVTHEEYKNLVKVGKEQIKSGLNYISSKINVKEKSVVVFNSLHFVRSEVANFHIPEGMNNVVLVDEEGKEYKTQKIGEGKAIFFAENIPAKGYKVFAIKEGKEEKEGSFVINKETMENKFFSLKLDESANIISIYDKKNDREVLKKGALGNELQAFEDKPMEYDNWDIDIFYTEKMWSLKDIESIEVVENGSVRAGLKIKRKYSKSSIEQVMYIYKDIPRIDFDTHVNWQEKQTLLKVSFPVDIHASKATYEIQFGNVERPTHFNTSWDFARFEVCGQKWADLSEDGFGVSLLNDSKYGHNIKDSDMKLTLLKSGIHPNDKADRGEHHFVYSIYPHTGSFKEAGTVDMAYSINVPLYTKLEESHDGILPESLSTISIDKENVVIETVKKAEDSNDIIVRMYECHNKRSKVNLKFFKELERVCEVNLMERELEEVSVNKNEFSFTIKPFEIKTFKLTLK